MRVERGYVTVGNQGDGLQGETFLVKFRGGRLLGLILGCAAVAVMIFMMFMILGGLLNGEQ